MAKAPAIEQVIQAVVDRAQALEPSLQPEKRFRRSTEVLADAATPLRAGFRAFNLDVLDGRDDSQEGRGGQLDVASSDHTARMSLTCSYPAGAKARDLETLVPSDGDIMLRGLARSAVWRGTPVLRSTATWRIDRERAADRWLLVVTMTVQYRDTE